MHTRFYPEGVLLLTISSTLILPRFLDHVSGSKGYPEVLGVVLIDKTICVCASRDIVLELDAIPSGSW